MYQGQKTCSQQLWNGSEALGLKRVGLNQMKYEANGGDLGVNLWRGKEFSRAKEALEIVEVPDEHMYASKMVTRLYDLILPLT